MAHRKKHNAPVPPGNRPQRGPADDKAQDAAQDAPEGAPFTDQDPKRRLGNYGGAGEHPYQQPGGLNDANH
jgi:hypothetical protein